MKKKLFALIASLLLCGAAFAQYPQEVIGDCTFTLEPDDRWFVAELIEAPISVPIDDSVGYLSSVYFDGSFLHVNILCLTNSRGWCIAPPLFNQLSVPWDVANCHFRHEVISGGDIQYNIFLMRDGVLEWHAGDWDVGNSGLEFGTYHTMFVEHPARFLMNKRNVD